MEQDIPLFDGASCAIFCCVEDSSPGREQLHAGFLVKLEENEYRLVDLRWHYSFSARSLESEKKYIYAVPTEWSEENQEIISTKLLRLARLYENQIPYSIAGVGVKFSNGLWVGKGVGNGLTCATFVSEFLDSLALPLIDANQWYSRDGDDEWREKIIGFFRDAVKRNRMTQEHVDIQITRIKESDIARVRPADVIVAASKNPAPFSLKSLDADSERFSASILKCTESMSCSSLLASA